MTSSGRRPADSQPPQDGYWLHTTPLGIVVVAVLLASIVAVRLLPFSELARAVAALCGFILIPLLIGSATLRFSPFSRHAAHLSVFPRALVEWLAGSLALVVVTVALALSGRMALLQQIGWLALALAVIGQTACVALERRPARLRLDAALMLPLIAAILLAITPKILEAHNTPFPLVGTNFLDPFYFAQPAARLLDHGYLMLENRSHPPGIVVLTAVQTQLYGVEAMSFLWTGPFALLAVFGTGMLLWGRALSGRWTTAVLATAVGVFLLARASVFGGAPLAFRSNQLLFAALPLALYLMHTLVDDPDTARRSKVEALVALEAVVGVLFFIMTSAGADARILVMLGAAALLGVAVVQANRLRWQWAGMPVLFVLIVACQPYHVYMAPVFLTTTIVYGLALTLRGHRAERSVAAAICAAVAGFVLLQHTGTVAFPGDFSLSSAVFGSTYESMSFSAAQRIRLLDSVLSFGLIAFILLGAFACLTKRAGPHGRAALVTGALMVGVYLLPDVFAYRTNKAMLPFLAFLVVAGADAIGSYMRDAAGWIASDRPLIQELAQLGLVAAVLPALLIPLLDEATALPLGKSHNSVIDDVDYELADWFRRETDENARIISDYQTMLVLSSLANTIGVSERRYLPSEMSDVGRQQMSSIKDDLLGADDGCDAHAAAAMLRGAEPARERRYLESVGAELDEPAYYIVWTAKTYTWTQHELGIAPVRTMLGNVYPSMVEPFLDPRFFELAAILGNDAYVFRVRDEPLEPAQAINDPQVALAMSEVLGVANPPAELCARRS